MNIKIKKIPIQFKYRNWLRNDGCGYQIMFLPLMLLYFSNENHKTRCLGIGWLF